MKHYLDESTMTDHKLNLTSRNLVSENISKLADVFPGTITESMDSKGRVKSSVDFDLLRQALEDEIVEGPKERYHLNWPGKRKAILESNSPITNTLRPNRDESVGFDSTKNLFIEGDNLEALKLLQENYLGKVKMIYIDPPYNTGRNLIYRNDFSESRSDYQERSGQYDEELGKLTSNLESNGRFHSDWLSMIFPRLRLAKNLLSEDGVLVITIDENEQATLAMLLEEVFGGGQFEITCVSVTHNPRGIQGKNFSYNHEYAFFVHRGDIKSICNRKIAENDVKWAQFRNWGGESERTDAKNCFYPVIVENGNIVGFGDVSKDDYHPNQTEIIDGQTQVFPIDKNGVERKWRYARQSAEDVMHMLRARKTDYGYEIELGKTFGLFKTVWTDTRYDSNEYGTKIVNSLIDGSGFTFPKSLWAVYDSVFAGAGESKDAIVLDFFAGSATTAHAVMELNKDDGGNRKFIMVQYPEQCDEKSLPYRSGFKTIAEISKERIRRAGEKILEENPNQVGKLDVGFRVLKIDSSNMNDVYYSPSELAQTSLLDTVEHIKTDRTSEDLLFQVMLDWGVDLSLPITRESIEGKSVYWVGENDLVACFDMNLSEGLVKAMAVKKPLRAVFRDDGFGTDDMKINAGQLFKQMTDGHTDMKVV